MTSPRYAYRLGWRSLRSCAGALGRPPSFFQRAARDLGQAMADHAITNRRRAIMFMATVLHESAGLLYWEEIASGDAYEGRTDLGNTHPGDGRRYKGRGPIQLTGRDNYRAAGRALGLPLEQHPELVARHDIGLRVAAWWWQKKGLNQLADRGNFVAVTRVVNGGTNGLASRLRYLVRCSARAEFLIPKRRKP